MSVKQTKGFYRDIDGKETFEVKNKNEKDLNTEASIVMDIASDKKPDASKIYLKKEKGVSRLTGNIFLDYFNKINDYLIDHSGVKIKELASIFRLMAVMINAGIPLVKTLNTMSAQTEKTPKLSRVMAKMAKAVEGGKSLSKSMADHPDVFSEAQIGAVQAGEQSGQLNKTLKDLAVQLEKSAAIKRKVKGALIYPVAIVILMVAVVAVMMTVVVPQVKDLFVDSGKELPAITTIMIDMSNFTINNWAILSAGILAFVFGIIFGKKTRLGKYYWDLMLIKIPVLGDLVKKTVLSNFAYAFGNLLTSGVPIIKAMEIVAESSGNEVYRKRFLLVAEDMKAGIPMAENMASSNLFPSILVNMIEIGEQTAQLENVTVKVAEFYDDEVDSAVKAFTKILEPLIIVVVGVVVGGIVAAIMLPILQLTDITQTL